MGNKKHFDFYPPIFYPSLIIVGVFVLAALITGDQFEVYLPVLNNLICDNFGWLVSLGTNFFLILCLYLAFSKFGKIRLGGADAKPDFNFFSWFSMLFTVGVSTGILFFSVTDPLTHFNNPPMEVEGPVEAAALAMKVTFVNFGFHPWSMYMIVGLGVGFFTFNRKLPLKISSVFEPVLGDRIKGNWGHFIDVATLAANLFGVALSLVISTLLVSNGLHRIFGLEDSLFLHIVLIAVITLIATISVVLGLQKGIRVLSNFNVRMALVLLLAMLLIGPTIFILDSFVQNMGSYIQNILELGTWTEAYLNQNWQNTYTIFYWIWYAAWAPFTGIFIARISRGRTVRQFLLTGLFAPSMLALFWNAVFGSAAIHLEMQGVGNLGELVGDNPANGFFGLMSFYPFPTITSFIFLVLACIFFITSSDSASLVNDYLSSGGKLDTPKSQKIFWGVTEGILAIILLATGGLGIINGAITVFGFVFFLILIGISISLYKGLQEELMD